MTNTNFSIEEPNSSFFLKDPNSLKIFEDSNLSKFLEDPSSSKRRVLREILGRAFFSIKSLSVILTIYWSPVCIYSIYKFLEICAVKLNIFYLVYLRLLFINFFLTKKGVFFLFFLLIPLLSY